MTPLKDTLDAVYPAAEAAVPRPAAPPAKSAGHLRSDAVSLEIPIRVHGSRVTEVTRGVTPRTEPFEEQSSTMIVFPQGGVLRLSTAVTVGQMLILTNLKSRQDAICRVVKVRTQPSNSAGYVEIEFTQRQAGFWGVYFPSDSPEAARKAPSASAPAVPEAPANGNGAPDASWAPGPKPVSVKPTEALAASPEVKPVIPAPVQVVPPAKPQSSFISLGSQENVQPAAAEVPRASVIASPRKSSATTFPPSTPEERSAAPSRPLTMEELLADVQPGIIPSPSETSSGAAEPIIARDVKVKSSVHTSTASAHIAASAPADAELTATEETFGARPDATADVRAVRTRQPAQNGMLIAACAALLIAGAAGGFFYLRHRHAALAGSVAATPVAAQPAPLAAVAANTGVPNPGVQPKGAPSAASHSSSASVNTPGASSGSGGTASTAAPGQPSTAAKHAAPSMAKEILGTLNAHPVASQSTPSQAGAAPAVAAPVISASDANALGGVASPAVSVLPPSTASSPRPVAATPQLTQPRLISSVQPTYPAIAAQMRTQGEVVIRAVVDSNGKVATMKVVSGPALLQQAALNALRQWKYEPAKLDGRPVPAEIQVAIRFRL